MKSGITRRWITGSLLITILVLVLAEGLFLYTFSQSYYGGVRQTMLRRFSSITGQLQAYTGETDRETARTRSMALRRMVEQFTDKEKYEFMLLDGMGGVLASSSGTTAEGILSSDDFNAALQTADGAGAAVYRTASGERVMAVCILLPYDAEDVAALRLITSLTLVDAQLNTIFSVSALVVLAVLLASVFSGFYFVRSIVTPLGQIETIAAAIAEGERKVRLPVTGKKGDEVDRLRVTINRMAEGLAETETIKNEFISSVSHELRTPLTSIKGWVETIAAIDDPQDENYRKGLQIISRETDRLYNMVEELLDFSRLQSGRVQLDCTPLDLVAELTDAVLFFEARIHAEGLTLAYEEPMETIPVFADPNRLRQVFINVLDNAIKYSAVGGRITIKVWAGKYKAFVEVLDQGRGIPPEDLENVKNKFFKGRNAVRGSGIGLALVEEIMTGFDGTVDLKSTLGRGTVVTLGLPLYHPPK
ncbi:MAG: HAMP domain-containing histidine kinase [Faecalibacterium sp.]|nr:HAMP domain-containing histidine kinase [Faecalibacterium sp.]